MDADIKAGKILKLPDPRLKGNINQTRVYIKTDLSFFWCDRPYPPLPTPLGQGLLIHEVSRSHTTTHHSR